jgi:hypothetical protein
MIRAVLHKSRIVRQQVLEMLHIAGGKASGAAPGRILVEIVVGASTSAKTHTTCRLVINKKGATNITFITPLYSANRKKIHTRIWM